MKQLSSIDVSHRAAINWMGHTDVVVVVVVVFAVVAVVMVAVVVVV
jgi:hypothetical protein